MSTKSATGSREYCRMTKLVERTENRCDWQPRGWVSLEFTCVLPELL
ncbi:hypothetical protein OAE78_00855 [Akkermansiaceae bacterium]|nr:hypothetical protein [Akkermansiaceae bacterium]